MKDAKGHGSNPRGGAAHGAGADQIGRDTRANAMAKRLKNQGTYYKNISEDEGAVSAVVPSKTFLRRAT
jgi:hypothetical protein